ncbi:hypothetical protein BH10PSE6_BH10PSE6_04670 [soil metagenome]
MIASRKHGFVFIKTMKTAGTTIELVLGPHCGPDDVVTPINMRFDVERAKQGVFPRNFGQPDVEARYIAAIHAAKKKAIKATLEENRLTGLPSHAIPMKIRAAVGDDFWESAFKFTSERHPYDKALSLAGMRHDVDINRTVFEDRRYVGHRWYLEEGRLLVDRVILFDRLTEDVAEVMARFGLLAPVLPRARYNVRDRRPAREQLTAAQRDFIYEQCAPEFELFGWER